MDETLKGLLDELEENAALVEIANVKYKQVAKKLFEKLNKEKSYNEKMMDKFKKHDKIESKIINLNVGGKLFSTTRSTLLKKIKDPNTGEFYQPSIFEGILNGYIDIRYDESESFFIDRDPKYFGYILDYLRLANSEDKFELPSDVVKYKLLLEAKFYNLRELINMIVFDTKILSKQQIDDFFKLCEFPDDIEFKLLYRATRDGFGASDFHSKCDNIYKTITIVKSKNGNIFGGYTDQCWDQSSSYKTDDNAFIFSLVNLNKSPIKIACSGQNAIYCRSGYGPTFGSGHDFYIASDSNSNQNSSSNFSYSFKHANFPTGSANAQSFLAGAYTFSVDEIEVFNVFRF